MTPWTEGNWSVAKHSPREVVADGIDGLDPLTGESVVGGAAAGPKAEANARMFAASKAMYEALVEALEELTAYEEAATGETYNNPKINAALRLARGEDA